MNIADAAYAVVHDYPGGSESLAPRLGMSSAVLRNKVNPNNTTHHLTVAEASRLTEITGDRRILDALAADQNCVVVSLPEAENCVDSEVIELMARAWETNGDIGKEISATFEDGRVEQHEVLAVQARVLAHVRVLKGLLLRLAGMAEK